MYFVLCALVFAAAYLLNVVTITVGYHRALAHKAVRLSPLAHKGLVFFGNWITGLDPKAWVVMHRLHHEHSDTEKDPHSPKYAGFWGMGMAQLNSYKRVIIGLLKRKPELEKYAKDLEFPLNWLNRSGRWYLPYVFHIVVSVVLGFTVGWLMAAAYYFGMVSHPVQGGIVNYFGHAYGPRNFDTDDNSRNNAFAAWLILGEGFQNNHHQYPGSARFSYLRREVDLGYAACLILEKLGVLRIQKEYLIPRPAEREAAQVAQRAA